MNLVPFVLALGVLGCSCSGKKTHKVLIQISKTDPPFSRKCPIVAVELDGENFKKYKDGEKGKKSFSYQSKNDESFKLSAVCLKEDRQEVGRSTLFVPNDTKKVVIRSPDDQLKNSAYSIGVYPLIVVQK